jgi:hypothetical protein
VRRRELPGQARGSWLDSKFGVMLVRSWGQLDDFRKVRDKENNPGFQKLTLVDSSS